MKLTNKKNGFTIVELVIVIAVIAILAAVLIPTFSGVVAKANASAAQQTAMNGVKAGLMMTSTATLPENSFILVDSDKNVASKPDYGYKYTGNSLGDAVALYDESTKAFKTTTLLGSANVILVNNECIPTFDTTTITADTTDATKGTTTTVATNGAAKFADLLHSMVKNANNATAAADTVTVTGNYTRESATATEWVLSSVTLTVTVADPASTATYKVYTSPDMPANVVVFVPMGD